MFRFFSMALIISLTACGNEELEALLSEKSSDGDFDGATGAATGSAGE